MEKFFKNLCLGDGFMCCFLLLIDFYVSFAGSVMVFFGIALQSRV